MKTNSRIYFLLMLAMVVFLCFYRIGVRDVSEWDEARNGVNALEMLHNGDYINLYYAGEPDTWNAKPPLLTWLIVLCYKLFGLNEFALRLPSAICGVLFFVFLFKLVASFTNSSRAFITCMILFCCKAIIGWHVVLSGDYDALLSLFLIASAWYFLQYAVWGKRSGIFLAAIFTGFAFYAKGPAGLLFLPGFVLFAQFSNKLVPMLKDYRIWLSLVIFIAIAGSWLLLLSAYGNVYTHSVYGSGNAIETMFINDTYKRMTHTDFDPWKKSEAKYDFVIGTLDSMMNLWNYCFYLAIVMGMYTLYRNRNEWSGFIKQPSNTLLLFSACIILPYFLLLSFAKTVHSWYMAPAWGFIAYITAEGIFYICRKWHFTKWLFAGLFLFTFGRHVYYIHTLSSDMHAALGKNGLLKPKELIITTTTPQHILLYLSWLDAVFIRTTNINEARSHSGKYLVIETAQLKDMEGIAVPVRYFGKYCIALIRS